MELVLKFGVSAVTSDGFDVGSLHHVVIDDARRVVTAITVRRRLLDSGNLLKPGGWTKPTDLRVELTAVTGADEQELRITYTRDEFLALPPYVMGEVPEPDGTWRPPAEYVAEDIATRGSALLGGAVYEPPQEEIDNRGPNDRHLSAGSAVWRRDPHTHLGDVDRVMMDDTTNALLALVVRHGVLFAQDTLLPAGYIADILDDLVHVDVSDADWKTLHEYPPEP
jgi:sporulation protein YlmC with PRC-barrel domain